jgi:hypothetical protein
MASLPVDTWLRLIVWMALGLLLYFAYGYRRSNLRGSLAPAGSPSEGIVPAELRHSIQPGDNP